MAAAPSPGLGSPSTPPFNPYLEKQVIAGQRVDAIKALDELSKRIPFMNQARIPDAPRSYRPESSMREPEGLAGLFSLMSMPTSDSESEWESDRISAHKVQLASLYSKADRLVDEIKKLNEDLRTKQVELPEEWEESGGAGDTRSTSKRTKGEVLSDLRRQLGDKTAEFKSNTLEITAAKTQFVAQINSRLAQTTLPQEVNQWLRDYESNVKKTEASILNSVVEGPPVDLSDDKVPSAPPHLLTTWKDTGWGQLLLSEPPKGGILATIGQFCSFVTGSTFNSKVDVLLKEIRALDSKIAPLQHYAPKISPQQTATLDSLKAQRDKKTLVLHYAYLQKITVAVTARNLALRQARDAGEGIEQLGDLFRSVPADDKKSIESLAQLIIRLGTSDDQIVRDRAVELANDATKQKDLIQKAALFNKLSELKQLEGEVKELNSAFESQFESYKKLYGGVTFSMVDVITAEGTNLASLGLIGDRIQTPDDVRTEKVFADKGYNMAHDVGLWFQSIKMKMNEAPIDAIKKEILAFIAFAKDCPDEAAEIAGKIAHLCSVIKDDSLLHQVEDIIRARTYTRAILAPFGGEPSKKKLTNEELFKYKALSDALDYAPYATAAVKAVLANNSLFSTLANLAADVVQIRAVQLITSLIPPEVETKALFALNLLRGKSVQEALAEQSKVAMLQVASGTFDLLYGDVSFLNVWRRCYAESKGTEYYLRFAAQRAFPVVSAVGGVASLALGGLPFLGSAAIALGVAVAAPFGCHILISLFFPKSLREARKKEREAALVDKAVLQGVLAQKGDDIEGAADTYIEGLRTRRIISRAIAQETPEITEWLNEGFGKKQLGAIKERLITPLPEVTRKSTPSKNPTESRLLEATQRFNAAMSNPGRASERSDSGMEGDLRSQIQSILETLHEVPPHLDRDLVARCLLNRVIDLATEEWLKPEIISVLTNELKSVCEGPAKEGGSIPSPELIQTTAIAKLGALRRVDETNLSQIRAKGLPPEAMETLTNNFPAVAA